MTVADDVLGTIADVGIVPVVTIERAADIDPLADALVAGGLPVVEITLRTPEGLDALGRCAHRSDCVVGAGTVLDAAQADAAVDAGARFVVSPGLHDAVVERSQARAVVAIPGVATPTELMAAARLGLEVVKFFPAAASGGAPAVRAMAAVLPQMRFVPTGGIDATNASEYLGLAGVLAVGGSWMAPRDAIAAGDWTAVRNAAAAGRRLVEKLR